MLCPAAHEYAKTKGVVIDCSMNAHHICNGERTQFFWKAWKYEDDGTRIEKESPEPCCSSCMTDEEYGRGDESRCCCHHWPL